MVPRETVNFDSSFEGNKINCFLRDQSLSHFLYSWKFIKPRCNSALLPSDVIDVVQRFWRETVSLLYIM